MHLPKFATAQRQLHCWNRSNRIQAWELFHFPRNSIFMPCNYPENVLIKSEAWLIVYLV